MNLAANVAGWNRYWVAAEKLAAMQKVSATRGTEIATRAREDAVPTRETLEQDSLFKEFLAWREKRGKKQ